jgi:hypothetical protein
MIEGAVSSYEKIKSKTSLREILEVACSFEASARDFYTDLIPKVGKNVRWVVEELAAEEQQHLDLLSGLASREDIAEQIKAEVRTPATDTRFSDAVHLARSGCQAGRSGVAAVCDGARAARHGALSRAGRGHRTRPDP